MNSIKDILRDSIVEMGLVENISLPYLLIVLGTAFVCAMIIYLVYKFFYRGAVYSENFGLLIIMSTLTVAFIIVTISSNVVLSLGMVGALSIVPCHRSRIDGGCRAVLRGSLRNHRHQYHFCGYDGMGQKSEDVPAGCPL